MKRASGFVEACYKITDLVVLNVLFVICCIPVFTVGASVTGLYYTTLKMVKNEETSPIYRDFFKSFRQNFKQATGIWLGMLAFGVFLYMDFRISTVMEPQAGRSLFMGFLLAMLVVFLAVGSYVFPMLARFENTALHMIRNAFHLAAAKLGYTFPVLVLNLTPLLIIFVPGDYIKWIFALYFFIWFSGVAYINSRIFSDLFDRLENGEKVR